jgi:hypothetical protein
MNKVEAAMVVIKSAFDQGLIEDVKYLEILEKSKYSKYVTVHGKYKTFQRLQEVGTEEEKRDFKESLFNLVPLDPTQNKKYLDWIVKIYENEKPDLDELRNKIEEFDVLTKSKKINADIYKYKTFEDLKKDIDKANAQKVQSLSELTKDFDIIRNDKDFYIVNPNSHEASRKLGMTTFAARKNDVTGNIDSKWCTTFANRSHWDDYYYKNNVTFYYVLNKKTNNKVAIAVLNNGQFDVYDSEDKQMSSASKRELFKTLDKKIFIQRVSKDERRKRYFENVKKILKNTKDQKDVDLNSLETLPESTKFENQGYVNLRSLKILPENTKFENKGDVDLNSLETLPESTKFENQGYVNLNSLETLPENTKFENQGDVDLRSLETLPENTKFENQGHVDLNSLETLPENTKFENQGDVDLRSLKTLPENTKFENQGDVNLDSLKTLPESTKFENQGYVNLNSLKTLPENTKFENKGGVYLNSLKTLPENTKFKYDCAVYLANNKIISIKANM